jgi:hypothetical protein
MKRRFAIAPWQAWLLAVLLLAAQAAGLVHRVAHGGGGVAHAAHKAFSASHDEGSAECRLVDQLTHADALCGGDAPAAPALAVQAAEPARAHGRLAEGAPAAYLARAPPRG